ncbi:MAG: 2-succinyl-5-enolpyruvyl-6-hydroxy-3-cyclohexene- 1-carboxylate synthase [Melioribacteraceae bacterium]|nr:MAG: 2-succinyl-5-enolpyruvyl-6-hydroxy-3-cyclohexene- 1-carboxylate synthase [Melioribacteraceae bacterium]
MKKSVNHNYLWADIFVKSLVKLGVENVCISPGSRSTPLTMAFSQEEKLKKYVIVDERSSGFFALGIAKSTGKPAVIITSSGTAVSELYPAIIEAYKDRIPLIICTADRPIELLESGANQTINQHDIFSNHIRKSFHAGIPELIPQRVKHLISIALRSVQIASASDPGPVHINFPFRKPFEPQTYTMEINEVLLNNYYNLIDKLEAPGKIYRKIGDFTERLYSKLSGKRNLLFIGGQCGEGGIVHKLKRFSEKFNVPVLLDGTSPLRYMSGLSQNFVTNSQIFLRSEILKERLYPDNVILVGNSPTSNNIIEFFEESNCEVIQVSNHSDWNDPTLQTTMQLEMTAEDCCDLILENAEFTLPGDDWLNNWIKFDRISEEQKLFFLENADYNIEPAIIDSVLKHIPDGSSIFVSNSLPVRDFDNFARKASRFLKIYTNRGASGIDGIISCAGGVSAGTNEITYLVIGDLSFFYDMNAMATLRSYGIPLKIVLINNNGGSIFDMLPISKYTDVYTEYFRTPLNLCFEPFVKAFEGNYTLAQNSESIINFMNEPSGRFSVIEFDTSHSKSNDARKNFYQGVIDLVEASI